jgi:sterol desaturase/sphingolipid hydroxylase (fatty acid hydroxylase superfamily)
MDFYFSDVTHVPIQSMLGAGLWCSTVMIRSAWAAQTMGSDLTVIMSEFSLPSILKECLRFIVVIPCTGILADLFFSPMHRWLHSIKTGPLAYKKHHKKHHEYTNKLTALVLFHGTLLDDFLMPVTTILGGYLYLYLASLVGLEGSCFSNFSLQLVLYNQLFSHSHDVRCASLVVPLPDSMNFGAYHRVHHLHPSNNFGLTLPSDLIWDRILGVNTILDITHGNEKST